MAVYINKEQTFFCFVGVVMGAVKGLHLEHLSFDKKSPPAVYTIQVSHSGICNSEQELLWTINMDDDSFNIICDTTDNIIFTRHKREYESITYWFDLQYSTNKMAKLTDDIRQSFLDYIEDALVLIASTNATEDADNRRHLIEACVT